jgi:DNA-binding winged helix-turn-helix (wHTH) protein
MDHERTSNPSESDALYEFGQFQLNPRTRQLFRDGQPIRMGPKPFTMLLVFIQNRDRQLSWEDLFRLVWPDEVIGDKWESLDQRVRQTISTVRDLTDKNYIINCGSREYRFVAPVVARSYPGEGAERPFTAEEPRNAPAPETAGSSDELSAETPERTMLPTRRRRRLLRWGVAIIIGICLVVIGAFAAERSLRRSGDLRFDQGKFQAALEIYNSALYLTPATIRPLEWACLQSRIVCAEVGSAENSTDNRLYVQYVASAEHSAAGADGTLRRPEADPQDLARNERCWAAALVDEVEPCLGGRMGSCNTQQVWPKLTEAVTDNEEAERIYRPSMSTLEWARTEVDGAIALEFEGRYQTNNGDPATAYERARKPFAEADLKSDEAVSAFQRLQAAPEELVEALCARGDIFRDEASLERGAANMEGATKHLSKADRFQAQAIETYQAVDSKFDSKSCAPDGIRQAHAGH